ncbi:MAG: YegP family protein [Rhodoferax sp.]|uniref:YegP family protein n=1 Tax=Rhodoferax sp. TaxID=50421 RepID=UPI002622719F|nr:YegP family protein [Rhodoferax sp.]MDD2880995.1 YegP family protein [Rhodoferax sp.]
MAGKFEITQSKNGKYMFNLKAGNGQIILTSQMYETQTNATQGIESCRKNGVVDERFERAESTSGQPYFNLKATNGQVIGRSEMYSSVAARDNGISSVKTNVSDAEVKDLTGA